MALDDFIVVIPPGWQELPDSTTKIMAFGEPEILQNFQDQQWSGIDNLLEAYSLLPAGYTTEVARLIDTSIISDPNRYRLLYRLILIP